jgi:hypothetical protein
MDSRLAQAQQLRGLGFHEMSYLIDALNEVISSRQVLKNTYGIPLPVCALPPTPRWRLLVHFIFIIHTILFYFINMYLFYFLQYLLL